MYYTHTSMTGIYHLTSVCAGSMKKLRRTVTASKAASCWRCLGQLRRSRIWRVALVSYSIVDTVTDVLFFQKIALTVSDPKWYLLLFGLVFGAALALLNILRVLNDTWKNAIDHLIGTGCEEFLADIGFSLAPTSDGKLSMSYVSDFKFITVAVQYDERHSLFMDFVSFLSEAVIENAPLIYVWVTTPEIQVQDALDFATISSSMISVFGIGLVGVYLNVRLLHMPVLNSTRAKNTVLLALYLFSNTASTFAFVLLMLSVAIIVDWRPAFVLGVATAATTPTVIVMILVVYVSSFALPSRGIVAWPSKQFGRAYAILTPFAYCMESYYADPPLPKSLLTTIRKCVGIAAFDTAWLVLIVLQQEHLTSFFSITALLLVSGAWQFAYMVCVDEEPSDLFDDRRLLQGLSRPILIYLSLDGARTDTLIGEVMYYITYYQILMNLFDSWAIFYLLHPEGQLKAFPFTATSLICSCTGLGYMLTHRQHDTLLTITLVCAMPCSILVIFSVLCTYCRPVSYMIGRLGLAVSGFYARITRIPKIITVLDDLGDGGWLSGVIQYLDAVALEQLKPSWMKHVNHDPLCPTTAEVLALHGDRIRYEEPFGSLVEEFIAELAKPSRQETFTSLPERMQTSRMKSFARDGDGDVELEAKALPRETLSTDSALTADTLSSPSSTDMLMPQQRGGDRDPEMHLPSVD